MEADVGTSGCGRGNGRPGIDPTWNVSRIPLIGDPVTRFELPSDASVDKEVEVEGAFPYRFDDRPLEESNLALVESAPALDEDSGESMAFKASLPCASGLGCAPFLSPRLLREGLPSLSLRVLLLLFASACFLDRATRSLWQAIHHIPCDVFAKISSSILFEQDLQRKQSA